jgi:hypothetical protein
MSNYVKTDEVQTIVNEAVNDLSGIIGDFATSIDERFTATELKSEKRFDAVDGKLGKLQNDMDRVLNRLDSVEKAAAKIGVEFTH